MSQGGASDQNESNRTQHLAPLTHFDHLPQQAPTLSGGPALAADRRLSMSQLEVRAQRFPDTQHLLLLQHQMQRRQLQQPRNSGQLSGPSSQLSGPSSHLFDGESLQLQQQLLQNQQQFSEMPLQRQQGLLPAQPGMDASLQALLAAKLQSGVPSSYSDSLAMHDEYSELALLLQQQQQQQHLLTQGANQILPRGPGPLAQAASRMLQGQAGAVSSSSGSEPSPSPLADAIAARTTDGTTPLGGAGVFTNFSQEDLAQPQSLTNKRSWQGNPAATIPPAKRRSLADASRPLAATPLRASGQDDADLPGGSQALSSNGTQFPYSPYGQQSTTCVRNSYTESSFTSDQGKSTSNHEQLLGVLLGEGGAPLTNQMMTGQASRLSKSPGSGAQGGTSSTLLAATKGAAGAGVSTELLALQQHSAGPGNVSSALDRSRKLPTSHLPAPLDQQWHQLLQMVGPDDVSNSQGGLGDLGPKGLSAAEQRAQENLGRIPNVPFPSRQNSDEARLLAMRIMDERAGSNAQMLSQQLDLLAQQGTAGHLGVSAAQLGSRSSMSGLLSGSLSGSASAMLDMISRSADVAGLGLRGMEGSGGGVGLAGVVSATSKGEEEEDEQRMEELNELHRRLRRMKSNRESARRARVKRQSRLEELELQSVQLREANSRLLRRALEAERRVQKAEQRNSELVRTIAELTGEGSSNGGREQGQHDPEQLSQRDSSPDPLAKGEVGNTGSGQGATEEGEGESEGAEVEGEESP